MATTILDREIRRGVTVYLKLHAGDVVEYVSKAGRKAEYEVVKSWIEDIMYGVYRGSRVARVELRGYSSTFTVARGDVRIVRRADVQPS